MMSWWPVVFDEALAVQFQRGDVFRAVKLPRETVFSSEEFVIGV